MSKVYIAYTEHMLYLLLIAYLRFNLAIDLGTRFIYLDLNSLNNLTKSKILLIKHSI